MLSIVGITAIVAQTKGNIQIRNMIPIDGIRSFAPFIHKHFGIIEQLIAFGVATCNISDNLSRDTRKGMAKVDMAWGSHSSTRNCCFLCGALCPRSIQGY